jgi:hypothetical protein
MIKKNKDMKKGIKQGLNHQTLSYDERLDEYP